MNNGIVAGVWGPLIKTGTPPGPDFYNLSRNAVYNESMYYLWFSVNLLQHLTIESVRIHQYLMCKILSLQQT